MYMINVLIGRNKHSEEKTKSGGSVKWTAG